MKFYQLNTTLSPNTRVSGFMAIIRMTLLSSRSILLLLVVILSASCSSGHKLGSRSADTGKIINNEAAQQDRKQKAQERRNRISQQDSDEDNAPQSSKKSRANTPPPNLSFVLFDFDSTRLTSANKGVLSDYALWLVDNKGRLRLEGHTDERGTREYNLALGRLRAQAVYDYLKINQVPIERMRAISYGEEQPFLRGSNERVWRRNRRVELVLL